MLDTWHLESGKFEYTHTHIHTLTHTCHTHTHASTHTHTRHSLIIYTTRASCLKFQVPGPATFAEKDHIISKRVSRAIRKWHMAQKLKQYCSATCAQKNLVEVMSSKNTNSAVQRRLKRRVCTAAATAPNRL